MIQSCLRALAAAGLLAMCGAGAAPFAPSAALAQAAAKVPDVPLDCGDPPADKPALPDGRTASREEMLAAVEAVKHFSDEVDAWLACKDKRATKVFQWMNEDQRARWEEDVNAVHNDRVALQRAMNEQIRLFNARLEAGSSQSMGSTATSRRRPR